MNGEDLMKTELNFKKEQTEAEKELMKEVYKIIGEPNHNFSDEITLLFYVGLYHKIENYENEHIPELQGINTLYCRGIYSTIQGNGEFPFINSCMNIHKVFVFTMPFFNVRQDSISRNFLFFSNIQ